MSFILPIHILCIIAAVSTILYSDHLGYIWIRGTRKTLQERELKRAHLLTWIFLLGLITTGGTMAFRSFGFWVQNPVFDTKMFFVGALLINALFIGKSMMVATTKSFSDLSRKEKIPLFISGAVSTTAWVGALICGLLL